MTPELAMAHAQQISQDLMAMHEDLAANPPRSTPTAESRANDLQEDHESELQRTMEAANLLPYRGPVTGNLRPDSSSVEIDYRDDDTWHPQGWATLRVFYHGESFDNFWDQLERLCAARRAVQPQRGE